MAMRHPKSIVLSGALFALIVMTVRFYKLSSHFFSTIFRWHSKFSNFVTSLINSNYLGHLYENSMFLMNQMVKKTHSMVLLLVNYVDGFNTKLRDFTGKSKPADFLNRVKSVKKMSNYYTIMKNINNYNK